MTCREMNAHLLAGGELSREARAHLEQCPNCRALAGVLGDTDAPALDPSTLEGALRRIPEDLAPVKPLPPARAFTAGFLFLAAALAAGVASLIGMHGPRVLTLVQAVAVFAILLATLLLAAFAVARDMRPGARTVHGGMVFALAFAAIEIVFLTLFSDYGMGLFVHQGIACFRMGMLVAAVTAILVWSLVRRGYVVAPVSTGAAIGALSGLAGLAALELHCPILYVPHLAVWHAAVVVVAVALGAAAGWVSRLKPA